MQSLSTCLEPIWKFLFLPLKKGKFHILMRLTKFLLALGLKGRSNRRLISMDEVKQHKKEGPFWTVLKGRVYNISPYMKFHPGGIIFSFINRLQLSPIFLFFVSCKG